MIGFLSLSEHIYCNKEVLGKKYTSNISGYKAQICFPRFPEVDENNPEIGIVNPLLPPAEFSNWKKGEEPLVWGYPLTYPSGDSSIELLALSFEVEKEQCGECASKVYEIIREWEHSFVDFLKLRTKQNTERDKNNSRNNCWLALYEGSHIQDRSPIILNLAIPQTGWFATEKDIIDAIIFADSGIGFNLEYQLLLSAYTARKCNQNRRAILDACAAVEIALDKQIEDYCQKVGLDKDILFNKYQSLGDKFDLVIKLGISLPQKEYQKLIVKPRNNVIHNREINPSDDTIDEIIECVEDILASLYETYY